MSAFASHAAFINAACVSTFGTPVSYLPKDQDDAISISAVLSSPAILEDASPKSFDHAFIKLSDLVAVVPGKGDTITLNAAQENEETYTVTNVEVDAEGGASLTIQQT